MQLGGAYLAGARFDIALAELKKGNFFNHLSNATATAVPSPIKAQHGEL